MLGKKIIKLALSLAMAFSTLTTITALARESAGGVINTQTNTGNAETNQNYVVCSKPLPTTGWSATLANNAGTLVPQEQVMKLFDNNLTSHVDAWEITGYPFNLDIDFGEAKTIGMMSVNKRPGYTKPTAGTNGTMGRYKIYTSEDGVNYNTLIKEGEFSEADYNLHQEGNLHNVGDTVYTTFNPVTTRYIRVQQLSYSMGSNSDFSSAEIDFYGMLPTNALNRSGWRVNLSNAIGDFVSKPVADMLIDGNLNSHPDGCNGNPFTIDINLGAPQTVSSLSIDKRPGVDDSRYGVNGMMGEFELYVSDDGKNYQLAGKGNFTEAAYNLHQVGNLYNVGDRVYANFFKTYTTQYVRIVQKTCVKNPTLEEFTTSEINLYSDAYSGPSWNTDVNIEEAYLAKIYGYTLTLDGKIGVNYYVNMDSISPDKRPEYSMEFTMDGNVICTDTFDPNEFRKVDGKTYYRFTCPVAAKEMVDTIKGKVIGNHNKLQVSKEHEYSVKTYCKNMLDKTSTTDATKRLLNTMLTFGGLSQQQFKYKIDTLASAGIDPVDLNTVTSDNLINYNINNEKISGLNIYCTLDLESETVIRMYITGDVTGYRFTIDNVDKTDSLTSCSVTINGTTTEGYSLDIASVAAQDLDEIFNVTVTDLHGVNHTISYSAFTYAYNKLNSGSDTDVLGKLMKAMYLYNQAANNYFAGR